MTFTEFLRISFCDATGRPDAKLLTVFAVAVCVVTVYPVGWLTGRWVPEYIFSPSLLFLAAGLGIDAFVTSRKIQAEAGPSPVVENAESVTVTQAGTAEAPATPEPMPTPPPAGHAT